MTREWKTTVQNNNYEVSNYGEVRRKGKSKCLKINYNTTGGYGRVSIGKVHTIVAYAFLGKRPLGFDINHIDGNKKNNNVTNLEYCTRSENCKQACNEQGLRDLRGEKHNRSILSDKDVNNIKALISVGVKNTDIAKKYKVDPSLISHIKRGTKR